MLKNKLISRSLALILCLAMVVGFVPAGIFSGLLQVNAASTQSTPAENMVLDPGFAQGDTYWNMSHRDQASYTVDNGVVRVKAKVETDPEGNPLKNTQATIVQSFTTNAYEMYELSLKYRWIDGGAKDTPYITLYFYKGSTYVGSTSQRPEDQSKDWIDVNFSSVAPAGANKMVIEIGTNSNTNIEFEIKEVSLVKTGSYLYAEMFDAFNTTDKPLTGPKGWTDSDVYNYNLVGCYSGEGSGYSGYSLHFQVEDNQWAESPAFAVKGGYDYTVKFMAKKTENNSSFTGYGAIVFLDADGNEVGTREKLTGRSYGEWKEEYFIGVAPANAVKAYLVFGYDDVKSAYGIDNLTVTESSAPSTRDPAATDPDEAAPEFKLGVINGDFEDGTNGWKVATHPGAAAEIVTDGAYKGHSLSLSAKATETEKAINTWYQDLECTGVKALSLSVMSKAANMQSAGSGYIGFWFYDADGALVPENTAFSIRDLGTTAEWKESTLIQAVPEGAAKVRVELGNNSGEMGLFYMVDDVKVEEYTGPADKIQPATPAAPSGGGGAKYPAVIVDKSKLNSSLEELDDEGKPIGWRLGGNPVYTMIKADDAPHGNYYIQMEKTQPGGNSMHSPRIACVPGETYELKVMARDIVGNCIVGLYVYAADGTRLDDACRTTYTDGSGKWKMYIVTAAMPENAAGIELEVWGAVSSTYTVQIDALSIAVSEEKVKPPYTPTPYTYPTIEEITENLSDVHPRIYFTPEEAKEIKLRRFNTLKTKYGWTWNKQYDTLLQAADAAFETTEVRVSMNTGKYVYMNIWEDVNSQNNKDKYLAASFADDGTKFEEPWTGFGCLIQDKLSEMMKNWSLAYIMTGKKMYAEQAIKMAMNVASWEWWIDKYWCEYKNIEADASVAWMMDGMAAVYDICYNEMTPEQRKTLERSIIEKGLVPLSKAVNPMSTVNGNLMMVGGILTGAAAILNKDNAEEVKQYLDVGLLAMHNTLDNYAYSGNTEGHYYTDFGMETFFPGLGHLYRTTKMEGIIDHYFLTDILPYWTIMWASNQTATHPNYSDASIGAYMKVPMGVLQKLTNDPLIDGFLINSGGIGSTFNNLVYLKPEPKPEYLSDYAGVIEEFGYGALRTGFADDDMLLTLKANDSQMGHNHYDQNGILFSVGGAWLIQDPGSGSYYNADRTFWTHNGHSTILVDDNAQMVRGTGTTKLVFNNNLYSYIVGTAHRAYGSDFDAKMLTKFDRHAIQVNHEDKGYYVIIDDLESADKARTYTWQMFNGSRDRFSVDGEDMPEMGTMSGNLVSMPLGKNVLNLNFIDSDKLEIKDRVWKSGTANAGMTMNATTTAASKAHQFMTVISTDSNSLSSFVSFYDILGGLRSTVPENIVEGELSWDSSMPLGQEIVKPNMIGTTPCVFFRGNKAGDWMEIPFLVEETGTYDFNLTMGVSDGCCTVKAILDDEIVSDPFDCSGLPEDFIDIPFGELDLEGGMHKIRIEVVGPGQDEDYEPGWYLINAGGIDLMRVGVEVPEADDVVVAEVIDNDEALAGMLNYKDNKFDFVMWNRTEGAATAGLLNTDGKQASVLGLIDGKINEGFAATGATTMTYDGKVLFLAEKKVDIVASNTGWQVTADEAQTIKLTAVESEYDYVVTVNGETVDSKIENGILTVALAEGENVIVVDVDEPEPTDPTKPTDPDESEPEPTEPDENKGGDATVWIIIGVVAALVLAGAAVGIVLFVKKRKGTDAPAAE